MNTAVVPNKANTDSATVPRFFKTEITGKNLEKLEGASIFEDEVDSQTKTALKINLQSTKLSQILRYLGAIVLIASAASFAVQSWGNLSALGRYYSFLGFNLVLAGAGIFCGVRIKEDKGARTFLALACSFLPALFIQLGAFVYYITYGAPLSAPRFFIVTASGIEVVITALLISLPLFGIITYTGFSALARSEARLLTILYFTTNLALLIPLRDANMTSLVVMGLFSVLIYINEVCFAGKTMMQTREGVVSRLILFLPILLIIIRHFVVLYPISAFLISVLFAMATVLLFRTLPKATENEVLAVSSQAVSFATTGCSWFFFVVGVGRELHLSSDYLIPLIFLPMSAIFILLSFAVRGTGTQYRRVASWIAIGSVIFQLFAVEGIFSSFLCIITAVSTIVGAFLAQEKGLFRSGAAGLTIGILYHLKYATELYTLSPWLSLAVMGTVIVVVSSYVERYFPQLVQHTTMMKKRIEGWR